MLRRWIIAYAIVTIAIALPLLLSGTPVAIVGLYFLLNGALVLAAVLFERARYRPPIDRLHGRWQATGERFIDPTSGHLTEVRFNPQTGERDYVDLGR